MRDAVIVEAVRTPTGKRRGGLAGVHPADLSAHVLNALVERAGVGPGLVDHLVRGGGSQVGEQTFDIARTAVLSAGWPEHVPGTTVDRQCGSSQQALHFAAAGVIAGHYDLAVAGGVESMSRVPMGSAMTADPLGAGYRSRYGQDFPNQGVGAEMIAESWGLSRAQLDEFALASHEKAAAAQDRGAFHGQIAPVPTPDGVVSQDEGIRRGGTVEGLAALQPAFREGGVVTAANASQISDGAAALLVTTSERARELGLRPIARVHTAVVVGSAPMPMLTGPIPATSKALQRAGLRIDEIGAFEVNEAFAAVGLASQQDLGLGNDVFNPNGGAIALGHPIGASGARLALTVVHELKRRGGGPGAAALCGGGGQGDALIFHV